MTSDIRGLVDCTFYVRLPKADGFFIHERININTPMGIGSMRTSNPPEIGDCISLYDSFTKRGGVFKVIARQWMHSSYGSANWPVTETESKMPPSLSIVVVKQEHHVTEDYSGGVGMGWSDV